MSEYLKGIPLVVSNADQKEEIQYTDKSIVALWDAKDRAVMGKLFHDRIRILNRDFLRLRLKETRLYLNNFTANARMKMPLDKIPGINWIWEQKAAIYQTRNVLIDSFEEILSRHLNDQTAHTPEPQEAAEQLDLVTNYGMERFAALSCNESNTYFNTVATGDSLIPAGIGQTVLFGEKDRISVEESGWMTSKGRLIRGGGEFPKTTPDYTCRESGIYDSATGGGLAWRTVYPANKVVTQDQDITYITVSHTVDQGSVGL